MATCEKKGNITITNKNGGGGGGGGGGVKTHICAIGRAASVARVLCAFCFLTTRILGPERKTVVRFFRFRPNFRAFKQRKSHKTPRNA